MGAVAALFVLPRLRSLRAQTLSFAGGSCLACLALLLFAGSRSFPLALLCLTVIGLGTSAFGTMQSTIILGRTSPAMRGRAMGLLAMAICVAPRSGLTGLMVERFGAPGPRRQRGPLRVLVAAVAWRAWRRPGVAPDPARVAMVTPAAPDRGP